MADAKRALTIKFSAKGEKKLIDAINGLASAQNRLSATSKKAAKAQHLVNHRVTQNTKSVGRLQSAISVYRNKMLLASFAITFVSKALVSFVEKAGKQEDSVMRLAQVFGADGARALDEYSSELQRNSTFGDENINMVMSQIGAFGASIEETKKLTKATIDLASGMNIDLNTAGLLVAKTIGSTTDALTRYGVGADGATEQSEKIANIIESVETKFGGLGEALAATTSGQLQQARNAFGDFQENIGKTLAPAILLAAKAFKALSEAMNPKVIVAMMAATAAYLTTMQAFRIQTAMATKGTILPTLAQGGLVKALKQAKKAQIALMATMKKSLWGLLAAAIAGAVVWLIDLSKWMGIGQDDLDEWGRSVMSAAEAEKELNKSIGDNIDTLQQELDLLNADNDMHRMAITLKRDVTLANYGLADSEVALFNQLEARKIELKAIADEEKEQIERQEEVKKILDEVASMHEDAGLRALKAKLEVLKAEMALIQALMIEHMLMEESSVDLSKIEEEYGKIEGAVITLEEAIANWGKESKKVTKDYEHALEEFLDTYSGQIDALMMGFQKLHNIFSELASAAVEAAQEHIDSINEIADAEIEIIKNAAKATLAEEKKTRRWQRMTAKQQADYEKKLTDEVAKNEAIINAQRQKDKEQAAKKANELMLKQFRVEQAMNIVHAIMNTSEAITKALPNVPLAVLVGILGAAEVAMIASQKPPVMQMAKGGLVGGKLHSQGGTMIEAERGEFVMRRSAVDAIGVETLNRLNEGGATSNIVINFSGNVLSDDYIEDEAIPKIKEALRRGGDIGVG